jgi:hypothetical protein
MAQTTVNPGGTYGLGSSQRRALAAAVAATAAIAFAAFVIAGPGGTSSNDGAITTESPVVTIPHVDDFVSRRYLSNPIPGDDSWKDDHITRRYLPGD